MTETATSTPPALSRFFTSRLGIVILVVAGLLLALLVASLFGRRSEELATAYGKRRGLGATTSVNGTGVLADMFHARGHKVRSVGRLTPGLNERADIIVWIPDGVSPPDKKQREFLETWLSKGRGRTLIYVGRDYDAASEYWRSMAPRVSGEDAARYKRFEAEARTEHDALRSEMPQPGYARWFTARRDRKKYAATKLQGLWAEGIDGAKAEILVEGRLEPPQEKDRAATDPPLPEKVEPLLWSDQDGDGYSPQDAIVFRVFDKAKFGTGQVIVVANGSFVLNYPLINHEHRKLAARLLDECGPGKNVAFIESEGSGPDVLEKEPEQSSGGVFDILNVWPLNAIIIHLILLGIVYCLARSPIFGRARELPGEAPADFGKHVTALGRLMERSKDRAYAEQRVQQYLQQGKRASGKSHLKGS